MRLVLVVISQRIPLSYVVIATLKKAWEREREREGDRLLKQTWHQRPWKKKCFFSQHNLHWNISCKDQAGPTERILLGPSKEANWTNQLRTFAPTGPRFRHPKGGPTKGAIGKTTVDVHLHSSSQSIPSFSHKNCFSVNNNQAFSFHVVHVLSIVCLVKAFGVPLGITECNSNPQPKIHAICS